MSLEHPTLLELVKLECSNQPLRSRKRQTSEDATESVSEEDALRQRGSNGSGDQKWRKTLSPPAECNVGVDASKPTSENSAEENTGNATCASTCRMSLLTERVVALQAESYAISPEEVSPFYFQIMF